MLGIWFAAVYNSHHYVFDVLAGVSCAILSITVFQWLANREGFLKKFITGYIKLIS
jgi:hypothetical protein